MLAWWKGGARSSLTYHWREGLGCGSCPPLTPPLSLAPMLPPHEQLLTVAGAQTCQHPSLCPLSCPFCVSLVSFSPCPHFCCSLVPPLLVVPSLLLLSGHHHHSPIFILISCFLSPCFSFPPYKQLLTAVVVGAVTLVIIPSSSPSHHCVPSLSPAPSHNKAL